MLISPSVVAHGVMFTAHVQNPGGVVAQWAVVRKLVRGVHAGTPSTRLISAVGQCSFALPGMRRGRIGPDSLQA